jgi:GTPase SAR1 family protein
MDSFTHIKSWLTDAKEGTVPNSVICVVGNKNDLKTMRVVPTTDAAKFCQENSMIDVYIGLIFFECSALDGENVENIFNMVTKNVVKRMEEGLINSNSDPIKKIDIKVENDEKKKGYCQCSS